ncbi:hypothetical protein M422DRAFT_150825 [Sphaerobolus stellatus SS14]|nr:hypothetical protein M422DRAFT_150825 [Sphaerobolus stellatus SS14]
MLPDAAEALLCKYGILNEWQHIVSGLREGFDVGIKMPVTCTYLFRNHKSSELAPEFIDTYIQTERAIGRYSRGYEPEELENIIGPFRTSPLGLTPKIGSSRWRLIQDMSFPQTGNTLSINAGINSDDFLTEWGTSDNTVELLLTLPPGSKAATFDISAAYHLTPIRPWQQNALCIKWKGLIHVDSAVMFGLSSSAGVFGSIADMLVAIYAKAGFTRLLKWVDNFLVIRLSHETWTEEEFMNITQQIGVPWSREKMRPLDTVQKYIGYWWDLEKKSVSLPTEKVTAILQLIENWLSPSATQSAKEAASLHGKLVHISSIFRLIRPFLRSISLFANSFRGTGTNLRPTPSVMADLSWIRMVIQISPSSIPLCVPEPVDINWWGDASTSFGIGIIIDNRWAAWKWTPGFIVGPKQQFDIAWAEGVAIELGLMLAESLSFLSQLAGRPVLVRSDNLGIVHTVNKGHSKSREANKILKNIYTILARNRMQLKAEHVYSLDNISDTLSRGDLHSFLS